MPALVNYSGDDEIFSGGPVYSKDSRLSCSIDSHLDGHGPPRKRARVSSPLSCSDERSEEGTPSIEVLPDECLFEIFRRLPGDEARSVSACVSKRWLMLLSSLRSSEICTNKNAKGGSDHVGAISGEEDMEFENDGCLTRSLEGKKATDIRLAAIAVGTLSCGGLVKLLIRGGSSICRVTDKGLSAIARACPSLRVLSLWNVPFVGDEGLFEMAKECHSLEKLDLCQCPLISSKGLIAVAKNSPNLTSLEIESCPNIGNETLQELGRCCPKLQCVTIKDCPLVGDLGIAGLMSSASCVLAKLKLQALNITDFSLAVIGHYGKALASLVLSGLQRVSERGFWVMGKAQGLEKLASLTISSCRGTTDLSLESIGKGCRNLKHLWLRKCCFLSDGGLLGFAKATGSLESLQLEECNRITQLGILDTLSNCQSKLKSLAVIKCMGIKDVSLETPLLFPCESLRSLSIRSCPGFGNASLAKVGKLCPQLHQLDLTGLCGITDSGLLPLVESCEAGLVKVNLSGCLNLTDEVVSALVRLHGGTLQVLDLNGCGKVTDASLVAVADNCLVLNDLDLSKCSISDSGVAALSCAEQLKLQILSLSGCFKISGKSILSLKKLGKHLVGLNLVSCNSISNSAMELLVRSLWRCDIVF